MKSDENAINEFRTTLMAFNKAAAKLDLVVVPVAIPYSGVDEFIEKYSRAEIKLPFGDLLRTLRDHGGGMATMYNVEKQLSP